MNENLPENASRTKKINSTCTPTVCTSNDSKEVLKCESCERLVHYSCTQLPLYQIGMFLSKNYEKYKCISCVKLPRKLSKLSKSMQPIEPATGDQDVWNSKYEQLKMTSDV